MRPRGINGAFGRVRGELPGPSIMACSGVMRRGPSEVKGLGSNSSRFSLTSVTGSLLTYLESEEVAQMASEVPSCSEPAFLEVSSPTYIQR